MPLIPLVAIFALIVLLGIALLPLSLVQRYRVGTARRLARSWFITLNLVAIVVSTMLFVVAAAVTTAWVPFAFSYTMIGFAVGCLLGVLGLGLTRWESAGRSLYYTPNRLLVLVVTLIVTARVIFGFWRSWHVWSAGIGAWSSAFGLASSMGAGASVLGYYFAYWIGVRRRLRRLRF